MNTTKIIKVEYEFDKIYRITTENNIVLDIYEPFEKPKINDIFEYCFGNNIDNHPKEIDETNNEYTVMNGTVVEDNSTCTTISFGGFLGTIPLNIKIFSEKVSLYYRITVEESDDSDDVEDNDDDSNTN